MKNGTKRSLVMSLLSMVLCMSMLIGTTFAWFTDSVSNSVNKIQSGNLDVELYHMNYAEAVAAGSVNGMAIPKEAKGYKVGANTQLFLNEDGKEMLWEPGATSVENFRIVNEGSLALKYQFKIEFSNATATPNGKTLADIINISASETMYDESTGHAVGVDGEATLDDCKLGALKDGYVFEEILLPGEAYNFWVGLQWVSSDIDNEFNVAGGLSIDLGVTLIATQHTYEKDNYADNQYDAGAKYPVVIPATKVENETDLSEVLESGKDVNLVLEAGEYKMPSSSTKGDVNIVGTTSTVLDMTQGAYMENANVTIEGVTIKTSTGYAGVGASDYAALYSPDTTYINCTFEGPMRVGRDGAKFINCTFTKLGNDYVWTYGNDVSFEGCTFNTEGKAILIYSDGGNEVSEVSVKNCVFNATKSATASAIANQNCAAIEIHNYGNGVNLVTENNTIDKSNFSGEWRIKTYESGKPGITVNGVGYTTIALDGKTMTIDADKNVTVK